MSLFLSILLFIVTIFGFIGFVKDREWSIWGLFRALYAGPSIPIMIILSIFIALDYFQESEPKAIDVYRGKTELRIEQKVVNDNVVSCDTTVVWKKLY